ncbi:Glyoxylase, beta-lactamase superfamily II [Desulfacinum infernum DSM 9756]|jgi:glyoxylase-like metal-dependent hydrolase (beta-lactamase superfamily II)|uniref:Glyoxylase, beta-lactamase superfamily II n=1 Tax=Desulfacinum infernum DSM 9756 TaxID=1121391 RepID=A0A1M4ZUF2_9BACT|nr:MBL fold metallo-hydrolase [Desulfacinum infernum]SHF21673.1 Glyoxylase, beta-lactamase superfamily II [Desulfacinum infernum DSM 9756]
MKIIQKPVGLMEVFCYLVMDEETGEAILIDPAGNEDELAALVQANKAVCRYIVNTHGHADHTCGNARMKELLGAPIVLHALDDDFFQRLENQQFARAMGFPVSPPADIRVRDGDELTFGKLTLRFLHTPGHTPGACCLLIDGNLFTGDTLFVGAVGRTDLPGASFDQLLQSLRKIIQLPPETVIWPGHDYGDRPTSTVADEMRTNPYITDFLLE